MSTSGDIMSTSEGGGGGGGENLNIYQCTHNFPPMYSWYLPDVLNIL